MEEGEPQVCRLCLSVVTYYEILSCAQQDMVQIIVPELDIGICTDLYICADCSSVLQETFSFKSTCLEIEDTIHNYTNNGQIQVNLDKIIGLKELEINDKVEKNTKICRTCLNVANPSSYININYNESQLEKEMLQYSHPEVDTKLTTDPILCKNCLRSLEKQFIFRKKCDKSEQKIWTYLHNKSDKFKDNFKLFDLLKEEPGKGKQIQNIVHEELQIDDDQTEEKHNVNLSIVPEEEATTETHFNSSLKEVLLKDSLLEELDTAILSCEDKPCQSKLIENELTNNLSDFIEEVSESSDETSSSKFQLRRKRKFLLNNPNENEKISNFSDEENIDISPSKKPYNTRNRRKKIIVDADDNPTEDPDFSLDNMNIEDESDDDYVEGSEKFGWLPKSRKLQKDTNQKRSVIQKDRCKFCDRQVFTTIMPQHLVTCSKNPKNNSLVECAHCGIRMFTMQKLQQHMLRCQDYKKWKLNINGFQSKELDNQIQQSVTIVYDLNQENKTILTENVLTAGYISNSPNNVSNTLQNNLDQQDCLQTENSNAVTSKEADLGRKSISENVVSVIDSQTSVGSCNKIFQKINVTQNVLIDTTDQKMKVANGNLVLDSDGNMSSHNSEISKSEGTALTFPVGLVSNRVCLEESDIIRVRQRVIVPEISINDKLKIFKNFQNKNVSSVVSEDNIISSQHKPEKCKQLLPDGISKKNVPVLISSVEISGIVTKEKNILTLDKTVASSKGDKKGKNTVDIIEENDKSHSSDSNSSTVAQTTILSKENVNDVVEKIDLTNVDNQSQDIMRTTEVHTQNAITDSLNNLVSISTDINISFSKEVRTQFLGILKCDKCSYNTRNIASIESHTLTHFIQRKTNEKYFCIICHKLKADVGSYIAHMKEIHKNYFYRPFYWCVKCAQVLQDCREFPLHECKNKQVSVKMFKSNGVVFCMLCKFESAIVSEAKQHIKICELKSTNLQPSEIIEIDDDD